MTAEFFAILFVGAAIYWVSIVAAQENEKRLDRIIQLLDELNRRRS